MDRSGGWRSRRVLPLAEQRLPGSTLAGSLASQPGRFPPGETLAFFCDLRLGLRAAGPAVVELLPSRSEIQKQGYQDSGIYIKEQLLPRVTVQ